jgi:D-specific alpha-keto acid dehydrogenase
MMCLGITVYGCEQDEAEKFHELSPIFGVVPTITSAVVSASNAPLAGSNRCISVGHKSEIPAATLRALKEVGVRYVSTRSIGCDHIDTEAAQRYGIAVGNVAYPPDSIADYTVMLMLMAIRNAKSIVARAVTYDFRLSDTRGGELRDMTVGVVGAGRIGKAVIERLRGFGCRVLTCGREEAGGGEVGCGGVDRGGANRGGAGHSQTDCGEKARADKVPLDELLRQSDIVTLHVPLNAETRHLIGRERIEGMKRGSFLINTGRGALVDTEALTEALAGGRLGGAALDVLEGEEGLFYFDCTQRPIENRFLLKLQRMPNVIITPHTAYYTRRSLFEVVQRTILNCLDFEKGWQLERGHVEGRQLETGQLEGRRHS